MFRPRGGIVDMEGHTDITVRSCNSAGPERVTQRHSTTVENTNEPFETCWTSHTSCWRSVSIPDRYFTKTSDWRRPTYSVTQPCRAAKTRRSRRVEFCGGTYATSGP